MYIAIIIMATLCKWKLMSPIWTKRSLGISVATYLFEKWEIIIDPLYI